MPQLFKPKYNDRKTGMPRLTAFWYARIQGKRIPLGTKDKRIAERKAAEIERQMELGYDPTRLEKSRRLSLMELLADFVASLRAKEASKRHIDLVEGRLKCVFEACGFTKLIDANAAAVEAWLSKRQEDGLSAQTRKHYAVTCLQFGRWVKAEGRSARNPFEGMKTDLKVDADRRRRRRPLTPDECARLLDAAATSPKKLGRMSGPDRRVFYAVALSTGLRRDELGSLTPESFRLSESPASVVLEGKWTKNRRTTELPLRQDVAAMLRTWLAGKPANRAVFPVKGKKRQDMLHADLRAAGIEPVVNGGVVDIHALRMTFVTNLALGGAAMATAQKLARHSDPRLTANVYTNIGLVDLQKGVELLPLTLDEKSDDR